ncbi:MAG: NAD(P)H-dependent oxidoreductase [Rhodospirillaceae bacterium]
MKVLILFAHPRPDRSEVNIPLMEAAQAVDGVSVVDLYAEYPSFEIDVDREQQRLLEHDVIVFQHPLYWFSVPALLKEWFDLVLEHGWAYGQHGQALRGKIALNAITAGAKRDAYGAQGRNGIELRALLLPVEKTAEHCHMRYLAPFALYGAGRMVEEGRLESGTAAYSKLLSALVEERLDLDAAAQASSLSDELDRFILSAGDQ